MPAGLGGKSGVSESAADNLLHIMARNKPGPVGSSFTVSRDILQIQCY